LGLRRRWDVVRYVLLSATAAVGASIVGVGCLIADHSIAWSEDKSSGLGWFLGDIIGLVGIAPFLLIHVFPRVRNWLSPTLSTDLFAHLRKRFMNARPEQKKVAGFRSRLFTHPLSKPVEDDGLIL
jgi:hypothetical protein